MLVLLRHGQSSLNAEGRLAGRLDVPLTPTGAAQAEAAARAIAAMGSPARVISSPLERARATASAFGLPVEIDDRWVELDYGELDGMKAADVAPEVWATWRLDPMFAPPGGESLAALGERVRAAADEVAASAADALVVVVTHVSPIKAAVAWALGVGDLVAWRMFVAPASITTIAVTERGPSLHGFNRIPGPPN